jgi:hypothetical protein
VRYTLSTPDKQCANNLPDQNQKVHRYPETAETVKSVWANLPFNFGSQSRFELVPFIQDI